MIIVYDFARMRPAAPYIQVKKGGNTADLEKYFLPQYYLYEETPTMTAYVGNDFQFRALVEMTEQQAKF